MGGVNVKAGVCLNERSARCSSCNMRSQMHESHDSHESHDVRAADASAVVCTSLSAPRPTSASSSIRPRSNDTRASLAVIHISTFPHASSSYPYLVHIIDKYFAGEISLALRKINETRSTNSKNIASPVTVRDFRRIDIKSKPNFDEI